MAGKYTSDNSGNILVEFDYNNIIVVDPNKTIDAFGKVSERLIDHENMVMYANLEAEIVPRTKLAIGGSPEDRLRTLSIAKINFLKPSKSGYLDDGYYDELTGKDTVNKTGQNQPKTQANIPKDGSKPYIETTVVDPQNVIDNGLLGITSIIVNTNTSFIPSVTIELEDVQGKALFQLGNNSPYSAFFNMPFCPFYLTLKGYYGQAIRYQLNLEKFNARFNSFSGNYQVTLNFHGFKFNVLNEISVGNLVATPNMYSQRFDVTKSVTDLSQNNTNVEGQVKQSGNNKQASNSKDAIVEQLLTEKGYQKIVEVYSEYKSKGLLAPNFPELTLIQLSAKLDNFEKTIADSYKKADLEPLTDIRTYKENLKKYFDEIRAAQNSWFNTFLNPRPVILIDKTLVYTFRENLDTAAKSGAETKLKEIVERYNGLLANNPTLGNKSKTEIKNSIKYDIFKKDVNFNLIDWKETTKRQTGVTTATIESIKKIIETYKDLFKLTFDIRLEDIGINNIQVPIPEKIIPPSFFVFDGEERFDKTISRMEAEANKKLSEYETTLTADLAKKIESSATGIGFKPTVRNITAVIMASAEAFIRLMDDVHTNAWNVKYDPIRKQAILDNPSSAPSTETKDKVPISSGAQQENQGLSTSQIPVYPWPQFFVETPEDKKGRFQLKYIADPSIVDQTQGWNYQVWPEVEFVEEFLRGLIKRADNPTSQPTTDSNTVTNLININAIEFPQTGIAYQNKEEIKFFYEIWERQLLTSHYSGLIRANQNQVSDLITLNIETETNNIVTSLGVSSPYLALKLKNFNYNSNDYQSFLKDISNQGTGRAYQDFIKDFYVTPYIKGITENSFSILNVTNLGKTPQNSPQSPALTQLVKNASNEPLIVDTYPFTNNEWVTKNMNLSSNNQNQYVYNTNKVLTVFQDRNVIANFNDVYNYTINRPVTNFSYLNVSIPAITNFEELNAFYFKRKPKDFIPSEGYCYFVSPNKNTGNQIPTILNTSKKTTSILNTPYFINAIQNGVYNVRGKDKYPYIQAAYLFLNSLPLASLRERYQSLNSENLDYISSCLKKFGAIHKMPYPWVLKFGSLWYRYKKYKESGIDILDGIWSNFNYTENYDPITNSIDKEYTFTNTGEVNETNIVLQEEVQIDEGRPTIKLQPGFYPKVVNDFNVFYNGYDLYSGYTSEEIQKSVNNGLKIFNLQGSNISGIQGYKALNLKTWSVLLPDKIDDYLSGSDCAPKDNTKEEKYFVVPSFGSMINQTKSECFIGNTTVVDLTNNPSMYNGSVRLLWGSSNYGYFDNDQTVKPEPDSYLNFIDPKTTEQTPMSLLSVNTYSKIEEIFSVFDKNVLDKFEQEFLNFCKPVTDIDLGLITFEPIDASQIDMNSGFKNFQLLFRHLMTINPKDKAIPEQTYFEDTIKNQLTNYVNIVKSFLEYDVILRYGNPSNYNRRVFDSFISLNTTPIVDSPIQFNPYVIGSLPSKSGQTTLQSSKINYPSEWLALETEVGFSTIPELVYKNTGSFITDFFIDNNIEFSVDNIVICNQLIKMYATQKLNNTSLNSVEFKSDLYLYLSDMTNLQYNFFNTTLTKVRATLPNYQQLPEKTIQSAVDGQVGKVETYESFKAINDKWIAGSDFKTKTLFEDFMFLDRASRNIGDTILVDIFSLKNTINANSLNMKMSVYTLISGILIKNNFVIMPLPAYVNFYNVQDVNGLIQDNAEGSLDFANNMWGTFLNVDYRNSSPKMVCFYASKPSGLLDLPKGNFRFRDDSFEMRRASENPLIEDLKNKKDWAVSNKCVGFNVDIGIRNQNVFYSFSVSQDNGKATSETIQTYLDMSSNFTGRNVATQNVSLYNLYKQRSYQCQVVSFGNAMIQPMMYFNLRHVPMFNGPYVITEVSHTITPGQFQTKFSGTRQGIYDLPSIDNYLQSINQNLLTKIEDMIKTKKEEAINVTITNENKTAKTSQKSDNTKATTNSCTTKLAPAYEKYIVENEVQTNLTPQQLVDAINSRTNNEILKTIIYSICYIRTFPLQETGGVFKASNYNIANIELIQDYGATSDYFSPTYYCLNVGGQNNSNSESQPIATFANLDFFINFMISRLSNNVNRILQIGLPKYYSCYWVPNGVSESAYDVKNYTTAISSFKSALNSAKSAGLNSSKNKELLEGSLPLVETTKTINNLNIAPSPTPTCPPPTINSFSPSTGTTGTIITIKGVGLEFTTGVTINGILVTTGVSILSGEMIVVSIPKPVQNVLQENNIVISSSKNIVVTSASKLVYVPK